MQKKLQNIWQKKNIPLVLGSATPDIGTFYKRHKRKNTDYNTNKKSK